jgi:hypothetical protein
VRLPPLAFASAAAALGCARILGVADVGYATDGPADATSGGADGLDEAAQADAGCANHYRATVLEDHPVAYFRLGEVLVASDEVDGGPSGAYFGQVAPAAGALHCDAAVASRFNGYDTYITLDPSDFNFSGLATFTLEAWVRARTIDADYRRVLAKEELKSPKQGYLLTLSRESNGTMATLTRLLNDMAVSVAVAFPDPDAGSSDFHHLVASFDGAKLFIYVDLVASSHDAMLATLDTTAPFVIGGRVDHGGMFDGDLTEVAVYDHPLPPERVRAHFNAR